MTDFNKPATSDTYTNILTYLNAKIASSAKNLYTGDTNLPTDTLQYNRTSKQLEAWNGSSWVAQKIGNPNDASVTLAALAAEVLACIWKPGMIVATGKTITDVGGAVPGDDGFLLCNGASLLRLGTYAALFGAIGTTFGYADATHFNLPDGRGKNLLGKAAGAGTGSTLGQSFGSLDHTHTLATHLHAQTIHAHTLASHTHVTTNFHYHSLNSHTHTGGAHSHDSGSYRAQIGIDLSSGNLLRMNLDGGSGVFTAGYKSLVGAIAGEPHTVTPSVVCQGVSGSGGAVATTGPSTANTSSDASGTSGGPSVTDTGDSAAVNTGYSGILTTAGGNPPELVINWQIKI
jgi:microcystin-dependent protein